MYSYFDILFLPFELISVSDKIEPSQSYCVRTDEEMVSIQTISNNSYFHRKKIKTAQRTIIQGNYTYSN